MNIYNLFKIAVLLLLFGCSNQQDKKEQSKFMQNALMFHTQSLHFLDSLHYIHYYNESRWKMYLKYCNKKIKYNESKRELKRHPFFGESNLYLYSTVRLDSIYSYKDEKKTIMTTLIIGFRPILDDTIEVFADWQFADTTLRYKYCKSHYYNLKDGSFYGYAYGSGVLIDSTELNDYCNGVPNCDSAKKHFIEAHKGELNPWFVSEAVKRGFISPNSRKH